MSHESTVDQGQLRRFGSRYWLLQSARFLGFVAAQMFSVVVGWQVYDITSRPLDLGFVGLSIFLPYLLCSFLSGDLADRFRRSLLLGASFGLSCVCSLALVVLATRGSSEVVWIYCVLGVSGVARALGGPAGSALLPQLVTTQQFPRAVALASSLWQVATILGPVLGGWLYAMSGQARDVYCICASLQGAAMLLVLMIRAPKPPPALGNLRSRLAEGVRFVWSRPLVLGAISLDLFAVLLGGSVALLPIFARDILDAGPTGLGMLRSAPAVGAAIGGAYLALFPIRYHLGRAMLGAVVVFGACTCVFALSRSLPLSLGALAILGAADIVSVVVRHTLIQAETPEGMRGRVSAVSQVFIGASNELGEFESGLTAHWMGPVPAALMGGILSIVMVALWGRIFPDLWQKPPHPVVDP